MKKVAIIAFSALLTVTAMGCTSNADKESRAADYPFTGMHADYNPAAGPKDLAARSDLVVRGTTGEPQEGRIWGATADDPGAIDSIVVPVRVDDFIKNTTEASNDTAYIEIFVNDGPARKSVNELLGGREAVVYATGYPEQIQNGAEIVNPDAGRPNGAPLYQLTTPQGFLIGTGSGLWSMGEGQLYPNSTLDEFDATSREFPRSERP